MGRQLYLYICTFFLLSTLSFAAEESGLNLDGNEYLALVTVNSQGLLDRNGITFVPYELKIVHYPDANAFHGSIVRTTSAVENSNLNLVGMTLQHLAISNGKVIKNKKLTFDLSLDGELFQKKVKAAIKDNGDRILVKMKDANGKRLAVEFIRIDPEVGGIFFGELSTKAAPAGKNPVKVSYSVIGIQARYASSGSAPAAENLGLLGYKFCAKFKPVNTANNGCEQSFTGITDFFIDKSTGDYFADGLLVNVLYTPKNKGAKGTFKVDFIDLSDDFDQSGTLARNGAGNKKKIFGEASIVFDRGNFGGVFNINVEIPVKKDALTPGFEVRLEGDIRDDFMVDGGKLRTDHRGKQKLEVKLTLKATSTPVDVDGTLVVTAAGKEYKFPIKTND